MWLIEVMENCMAACLLVGRADNGRICVSGRLLADDFAHLTVDTLLRFLQHLHTDSCQHIKSALCAFFMMGLT